MKNLINKDNALANSPEVGVEWKQKTEKERILIIEEKLKTNPKHIIFEVFNVNKDAQVILKTEQSILAKERGLLLLEIEEVLKKSIEEAITVWLEPIGDKSKLRNLRGITIKSVE